MTFCEIFPPDDFPLYFYRQPDGARPADRRRTSSTSTRSARPACLLGDRHRAVARSRAARRTTPRWAPASAGPADRARPRLPADVLAAPRTRPAPRSGAALPHVTVAVGNLEECEVAVGERDPQPRRRRPARPRASSSPSSSRAREGVLGADARPRPVEVPPMPVEVVNGLGAGDGFGGALCHGLLAGWPLERVLRVRQRGRRASSPPGWSARPRCRRPPRSRSCCRRPRRVACRDRAATWTGVRDLRAARARGDRRGGRRRRRRRPLLGDDGRLMLVAADHPARGALGVRRAADRDGRPRRPARPARARAGPARRRRRARHPRHPRGPAAARRARRQGRHRLDEPRRAAGRRRSRSTTGSPPTTRRRHRRRRASTAARCCCGSTSTDPATAATLEALRPTRSASWPRTG